MNRMIAQSGSVDTCPLAQDGDLTRAQNAREHLHRTCGSAAGFDAPLDIEWGPDEDTMPSIDLTRGDHERGARLEDVSARGWVP